MLTPSPIITPLAVFPHKDTNASVYEKALISNGVTLSMAERTAVYTFFGSLKAYGLYDKLTAFYPVMGALAGATKLNAKSPGVHDIAWNGTVTHNANGVTSDGSTGYGLLDIKPSDFSNTSISLAAYTLSAETTTGTSRVVIGSYGVGPANLTGFGWADSGTKQGVGIGALSVGEYSPSASATQLSGMMIGTCNGDRSAHFYNEGSEVGTAVTQTGALNSLNFAVLAANYNGTILNYSTCTVGMICLGTGLTATDAANLTTIVRNFMYSIGRYDTSAQTYFTALTTAGATLGLSVKNAYSSFNTRLKNAGIWSNLTALYPFIGGTAATHSINAKTPGTYNITWKGTLTHSASGVQGDGSTGYGSTGIVPATVWGATNNLLSFGVYCVQGATPTSTTYDDFGSLNSDSQAYYFSICPRSGLTGLYLGMFTNKMRDSIADTPALQLGLWQGTGTSTTNLVLYKNSTNVLTDTSTRSTSSPTYGQLFLMRVNRANTGYTGYSSRKYALNYFGSGLSVSQLLTFNSANTILQTALGRAV